MLERIKSLRPEIVSGLSLSLIALPLSIGIAVASGVPPAAGIIAAVIGGILGTLITGSYVTINGPAAGLSVVVLTAVQTLGAGDAASGYRQTLAVTIIAGGVQIVMGLLKAGRLGLVFPSAAIHGLLSAIGLIIMAKQLHVLLGVAPAAHSIFGLIGALPSSLVHLNLPIAIIGLVALGIMIGWPRLRNPKLKALPAPLVAVAAGLGLGLYFDLDHPHLLHFLTWDFMLDNHFLLGIPSSLGAYLVKPDFSHITSGDSLHMIILIALVASVESVLSAHAVDKLDPEGRKSNLDRELMAKGFLNMVSGAIGGLPIIAEIVRSSANVAAGARSRWSNFFHGVFVLAFVAAVPGLLHEIPLAALAAVLVTVGFRLAHPKHLAHLLAVGWDQALVYGFTIVVCLATDILVGVLSGLGLELLLNAWRAGSLVRLFKLRASVADHADFFTVDLEGPLVFSNILGLKKTLAPVLGKRPIRVNLSAAAVIDHTAHEHLGDLAAGQKAAKYGFELTYSDNHKPLSNHPLSARRFVRRGRKVEHDNIS